MKRVLWITMLLTVFMLAGCGLKPQPPVQAEQPPTSVEQSAEQPAAQPQEEQNPAAAELGREEKKDMVFMLEGMEETVPVTLYIGQGYSIYIPDEGWRLEKWVDDGIPEDTWESIVNDDVELTVSHYAGKTAMEARDAFVRDEDYVFEDLMGGELGDPLTGMDEDGDYLSFMVAEGADTVYVISWEYPAESAEGFGTRLGVMADTFQVME